MSKKIVLLLLIIVFASSCVKFPTNSSTFEGNINFRIDKRTTGQYDDSRLYLYVSTKEIFPCVNYHIGYRFIIKDNTIKVILGEIAKPDMCLTALGPASFSKRQNRQILGKGFKRYGTNPTNRNNFFKNRTNRN